MANGLQTWRMANPPVLVATLRAEMARRGRTQADLAAVLGINSSGISERFKGRTPITVDELILFADFLDIPLVDLLRDVDQAAEPAATSQAAS